MFRPANRKFSDNPVYAPADVLGAYTRRGQVSRNYPSLEAAQAAGSEGLPGQGFYEVGLTLRPGAQPTHWVDRNGNVIDDTAIDPVATFQESDAASFDGTVDSTSDN